MSWVVSDSRIIGLNAPLPGGEIGRAHGCALDTLVHAQQSHRRGDVSVASGLDEVAEFRPHVVTLRREPGQRHADTPHLDDECARRVEQVYAGVMREPQVRNAPALVVAGNDKDRHPAIGDSREGLERLPRDAGWHAGPVEYVSPVHHQVDVTVECALQRSVVVGEEIVTPPPALDSRAHRQVEAEVRIGEEEDADGVRHTGNVIGAWHERVERG